MRTATNLQEGEKNNTTKKVFKKDSGVITNPEIIRRIEEHEQGKTKGVTIPYDELKSFINTLIQDEKYRI